MGSMVATMSRARRLHGRTRPSACIFMILALAAAAMASAADGASGPIAARVARVLKQTPLIDGHNDLALGDPRALQRSARGHRPEIRHLEACRAAPDQAPLMTDIVRLRAGMSADSSGRCGCRWTCKGAEAVQMTLEQIDLVKRMAARYPADLEIAYTAADVRRIHRAGQDRLAHRHRGRPPDQQFARACCGRCTISARAT